MVSKSRHVFVVPNSQVVAIASDNDTVFGILPEAPRGMVTWIVHLAWCRKRSALLAKYGIRNISLPRRISLGLAREYARP